MVVVQQEGQDNYFRYRAAESEWLHCKETDSNTSSVDVAVIDPSDDMMFNPEICCNTKQQQAFRNVPHFLCYWFGIVEIQQEKSPKLKKNKKIAQIKFRM